MAAIHILLFAFPLAVIWWLLRTPPGWVSLAGHFRRDELQGKPIRFSFITIIWRSEVMTVVTGAITPEGLGLRRDGLFRSRSRPLIIPWSAIEFIRDDFRMPGGKGLLLQLGEPAVGIRVFGRIRDEVLARAAEFGLSRHNS